MNNNIRKKVFFIINSISGGGAERIMQNLIASLDKEFFEPYIFLLHKTGKENKLIPPNVPYYVIGNKSILSSIFSLIKLLYYIVKLRPKLLVSALWRANIISSVVSRITGVCLYAGEHTLPGYCLKEYLFPKIWTKVLELAYKNSRMVITVSDAAKEDIKNTFNIPEQKIVVIENGVDIAGITKLAQEEMFSPWEEFVISAGRLEIGKNFISLIEYVKKYKMKYGIDLPIIILGEGSQRKVLKTKALEAGVQLYMPGFIENPYALIMKAKVFIVVSNYESFHLGICEAMACKTPVIAVNSPGGINGLIKNGENGFIFDREDTEGLLVALNKLLKDHNLVSKITENAYRDVVSKYDLKAMVTKYIKILNKKENECKLKN